MRRRVIPAIPVLPVTGVPYSGALSGKSGPRAILPISASPTTASNLHTRSTQPQLQFTHTSTTVDLSSISVPIALAPASRIRQTRYITFSASASSSSSTTAPINSNDSPRTKLPESNETSKHQEAMTSFYDLKADLPTGQEPFNFDQLKGNVVLIVNVASQCGFTPQYKGLEALYEKYKDRGLVILGFPSNQFGGQEPGTDDEIATFCQKNHGVTFPLMKKSDVNGDGTNEVYKWLKKEKAGILGLTRIKWNFEKFLVDQNGKVVHRWASTTTPAAIDVEVAKLLPESDTNVKPADTEPATKTSTAAPPESAETTAA